jgi:hypothetical protein
LIDPEEDFQAFVAEDVSPRPGMKCWLCHIPERPLVEREMANGRKPTFLVRWLEKRYPDLSISPQRLTNHWNRHVR